MLFADRARGVDARFTLDRETGLAVGRLVTRLDGMPLAIELAAAQVEALGVTQLLGRLDERFALLTGGDRLAPSRQRSLAATVDWSYQLLDETQRRVFRAVSVFPAGFTLEAAEAVAGKAAGPAVLRLVDCSLLTPPRPGPDGRLRYSMLETLRGYGAGRLAEAGERDQVAAALAGYALNVAEQAAAGLRTRAGEPDAARWLDAEDATMRASAGLGHGPRLAGGAAAGDRAGLVVVPARPASPACTRCCARSPDTPSRAVSGGAPRSVGPAGQRYGRLTWPGRWICSPRCATPPAGAVPGAGRRPGRPFGGLVTSWAGSPRRPRMAAAALAVARELGYPVAEVLALAHLASAAAVAGDLSEAVRLARQTDQFPGDIPASLARACSRD